MPEKRRKYDPEFREGAVRIVGRPASRSRRWRGISGSTRARWATGWTGIARPGEGRGELPRDDVEELNGSERRTPSCGWSVMSSSDPWSCGCYPEFLSGVMILNLCVYAGRSFAYASASGASGCRGVVSGSMGAETAT